MNPLELSLWDKANLSPADQAIIKQLKESYMIAKNKGDESNAQKINEMAEQVRANYGYLGGSDGSGHTAVDVPDSIISTGSESKIGIYAIVGIVALILLGR